MENHRLNKSREEFTLIRLRIEISKEKMAEQALVSINGETTTRNIKFIKLKVSVYLE